MNRGTVMALNKRTAVVLTLDGQFIRVKREPEFIVGDEISVSTVVHDRAVPRIRQRWLQAGAMVTALLIILIGLFMFRSPSVVAYVTMDINPSIELGLDAPMAAPAARSAVS